MRVLRWFLGIVGGIVLIMAILIIAGCGPESITPSETPAPAPVANPTEKTITESSITTSEGRVINRQALSSQQVYQEVLESVLAALPLGLGNIAKIVIKRPKIIR